MSVSLRAESWKVTVKFTENSHFKALLPHFSPLSSLCRSNYLTGCKPNTRVYTSRSFFYPEKKYVTVDAQYPPLLPLYGLPTPDRLIENCKHSHIIRKTFIRRRLLPLLGGLDVKKYGYVCTSLSSFVLLFYIRD